MPLAKDLMGVGMTAEEALREGDTVLYQGPTVATNIGGPNGATIIEFGPSCGVPTFLNTTEYGRVYTLYNLGVAISVNVPVSAGTGITSQFQNGASAFSLTSTKTAYVTRLGVIGTVNTTTDRWIYTLSS